MANYYGVGRTNYVKVKDPAAFREAAEKFARVYEEDGAFVLLDDNPDGGGWSFSWYDEEDDDYRDIDPIEYFAPHLQEGEVMIFTEAGHEKYRYVGGWALAFNSSGESIRISLDDIYDQAKSLGPDITEVFG